MTEYYAYTGSTKTPISDESKARRLATEYQVVPAPLIEVGTVKFQGDGTFFSATHDGEEDAEEAFLQELSEVLEGELIIDSVGFNPSGGRPNAVSWIVSDGEVTTQHTPAESEPME